MSKKIKYSQYYDKVLGGLVGKFIGGTIGGPREGNKSVSNLTFYKELPSIAAENDDNDYVLLLIHMFEERGYEIDSDDIIEEMIEHLYLPWCEYGYMIKNYRRGIMPPLSGVYNNDYFGQSQGCPVRSEAYGFTFIGNPELAAKYAEMDGCTDHFGESVWTEMFYSAIESAAFFESDLNRLINIGLGVVPPESKLHDCVRIIRESYKNGDHWLICRQRILNRYGSPDFTSLLQNAGITIMALVYGESDFEKTQLIAVNSGYDADCTCATSGAILGAIMGINQIPDKWKKPIGNHYQTMLKLDKDNLIMSFAEDICRIGVWFSKHINQKIEITEVPSNTLKDIEMLEQNVKKKDKSLSMEIDYQGMPVMDWRSSKGINIAVNNRSRETLNGVLKLDVPKPLIVDRNEVTVKIGSGKKKRFEFSFSVSSGAKSLPMKNLITINILQGKKVVSRKVFGIAGASCWTAFGAFWQSLPPSKVPPSPYPSHLTNEGKPNTALLPMECMMSNEMDINKEYLPEPFIDRDLEPDVEKGNVFEKIVIASAEDRIDLNKYFPFRGPAVVYLLRYIKSPSERLAWFNVGTNDALKVWLNDQLIHSSHNHLSNNTYCPFMEVTLTKGINKILLKVGRCSDTFDLRFAIRKNNHMHWHQCHHMVDIEDLLR